MAFILRDSQDVVLRITATDRKGNPASVQNPTWASSDTNVATVLPADDGLSAAVSAAGPLGTVTVSVEADADLGEGVRLLTGTLDIEVVSGDAAVFNLEPGTPTEQP